VFVCERDGITGELTTAVPINVGVAGLRLGLLLMPLMLLLLMFVCESVNDFR